MTAEHRPPLRRTLSAFGLRIALGLSAVTCLTLSAEPACAQSASDSATAQALFDRGKKLMKEGKFAEASSALEESERIEPRSGTLLNLAACYEQSGRLASAWSSYLEAATLAKSTGNAERERGARERAAALAPRLSKLVIIASSAGSTAGLEITRDGQLVGPAQWGLPLPADAGAHSVAAKAPGRKPWQTTVTILSGTSTANVAVPELEEDTPVRAGVPAANTRAQSSPPPSSKPDPDHGAPGGGHAGAIAGTVVTGMLAVGAVVTSVLYNSKLHEYNTANDSFANKATTLRSQTKTLGAANLALIGGAVVAAGVTIYLWTRPSAHEAPNRARLELHGVVSPGLAGLSLGGTL